MSNGKGDKDRVRNRKAFGAHHEGAYGKHEKVDGRRTKIVIRGGELVRNPSPAGTLDIQPIPPVPSEYSKHLSWLQDKVIERYSRPRKDFG